MIGSRWLYIKKALLQKHGYTTGCAACDAHNEDKSVAGKKQTLQCREGLDKATKEDPDTANKVKKA